MSVPNAERGLRGLFFAHFAYVGGFSPYVSLYLSHCGFGAGQIGVLMTLPQVLRIVAPPFWGWLAGRASDRILLLTIGASVSMVAMLLLPLTQASFAWTALALSIVYFANASQSPIAESMALAASRGDAGRYGRMRSWGSIGFICAVVGFGPALDTIGVGKLPWLAAGLLALLALAGRRLRDPRTHREAGENSAISVRSRLREWPVAGFFASALLMIFAHAAFYAYFSLFLEMHGYTKTQIGLIWAFGVIAEIALFRWQRPLFVRFGAPALLSASLLTAAVRFALIATGEGAVWLVLLTQAMHAVTFGVHHSACMSLLHRWFDLQQQPRAQALYTTASYGVGGTLGGLAASALWVDAGPQAAFLGGALAALLGWVAALPCRRAAT